MDDQQRPNLDYDAILDALAEGEIYMVHGRCRHFWRKKWPVVAEPGGGSGRYIQLPRIEHFCDRCIARINAGDRKLVAAARLNPATGRWAMREIFTGKPIGEVPPRAM